MTSSEFYNSRLIIEQYGKSKSFELFRRMREVWPAFPSYSQTVNEFISAWLIYLLSVTPKAPSKRQLIEAIGGGKSLMCDGEGFIVWLGNLLTSEEEILKIRSIWIFENSDFVQVNYGNHLRVFQGNNKPGVVSKATVISPQFLIEFYHLLNETLIDESVESEQIL